VTGLLADGGVDAVAVVLVGDELLLGTVSDTNGGWLAQQCSSAGLRVVAMEVVPDEVGRIVAAVRRQVGAVGAVVLSGGIGPTSDDLTRQALARACGCPLVTDEAAAALVSSWFTSTGRPVPDGALRMAQRPECAQMLVNPAGSAPGVALEMEGTWVVSVPGVPGELRSMMTSLVLPRLLARAGVLRPLASTSIEVALLGESAVAARLAALEASVRDDPSVDVAYLARPGHVSVRISVRDVPSVAAARLRPLAAAAQAVLGADVVGRDGATAPLAVVEALAARGQTVACAESLTAGGVSAMLASVPGASAVLRGGVVAYATDVKHALLRVPDDLLAAHGPVHPDVALAMAQGAREAVRADWAVATTGVAGPDPVGPHPPGEVYVAVAGPGAERVRHLTLPGDRGRVRGLAAAHAVDLLRRCLLGLEEPSHGESFARRHG
jgi:nicotinamide-nucleotide amidase